MSTLPAIVTHMLRCVGGRSTTQIRLTFEETGRIDLAYDIQTVSLEPWSLRSLAHWMEILLVIAIIINNVRTLRALHLLVRL